MSSSKADGQDRKVSKNWLGYISILISAIALIVSFGVAYQNVIKPFQLEIHIDPIMQVQHKINLGVYLSVNFFNNSPKNGQITDLGLVLYKTGSEEDKYLLTLWGFRVIGEDGNYIASEEKLPLFFQPWQRNSKMMNFIYLVEDEQFPLSSVTYIAELLVWTDYTAKPKYIEEFKFDISGDILKIYMDRKELGYTTLEPLAIVGYTPLKSRKLTHEDYMRLH